MAGPAQYIRDNVPLTTVALKPEEPHGTAYQKNFSALHDYLIKFNDSVPVQNLISAKRSPSRSQNLFFSLLWFEADNIETPESKITKHLP